MTSESSRARAPRARVQQVLHQLKKPSTMSSASASERSSGADASRARLATGHSIPLGAFVTSDSGWRSGIAASDAPHRRVVSAEERLHIEETRLKSAANAAAGFHKTVPRRPACYQSGGRRPQP